MNSIDQLNWVVPTWATIAKRIGNYLNVKACAPMPSGASGRTYELVIKSTKDDKAQVSECTAQPLLPKCCLERHINSDGTFCLHIDSTKPILNSDSAITWWNSLRDYLNHQDYSSRRRKWPIHAQLSHGDAALVQLKMEELAEPLAWKQELLNSLFRGKGWLANELPRRRKDHSKLVNARAPCPRGCHTKHHPYKNQACQRVKCAPGCKKRHHPILRVKCPHRALVEELVLLEHLRRQMEDNVVTELRSKGVQCCRTMDDCALADR